MNIYIKFSLLSMALAVVLGAFGAHSWNEILANHMSTFKTANQYHFIHSLGILVLVILSHQTGKNLNLAALLLSIGLVLFSGSLYLLSFPHLTGEGMRTILGPITPIGGLLFVSGWCLAAFVFLKKN